MNTNYKCECHMRYVQCVSRRKMVVAVSMLLSGCVCNCGGDGGGGGWVEVIHQEHCIRGLMLQWRTFAYVYLFDKLKGCLCMLLDVCVFQR